ncbi:glutamine ABC transporter ATP-binding protein [Vibrio parahaemolyticus]|uniref:amino acid ABC transporter ATP-binding protein n=1 Tax=Vibrio parahaemolyticus TaxID=670 RepID=UPI00061ADEAA|nr:amino acid ABC transporter ATP-binding protein [Vibrio parahaemolyticus]EGQ8231233.1 ATP-binding cassette domain-containing protein [Vibrio parahaemolyticus]EGQ8283132.1 ATP-binding cassette domain-containing protein [Vibrio parahaemolyticus]EGQ8332109.1 ATP-binding cassette domain-containing protein [Vibrio parahaemolyticus]EHH2420289.1 amino acid ABC transporter ATP-binding protein [Vibrio parahaemolyticus]EHH2560126.1 amino acid ABC transporter ATP-binding protein [Vibrio parahaemolyticu
MKENTPVVEFSNVNKWYGDYHALKDINFSVHSGEIVVVCGPSGSGKSTLIRCINHLESIQEGQLYVFDQPSHAQSLKPGKIGMVFQHFHLFPHLTVLENLTLAPIRTLKLSKQEAEKRARHYLKRVNIEEQASKYPIQLSGGQQQRVAIARSLCMEPDLLLFDEPTSALDPEMINEVLDAMVELAQSGMTMICVTHEMGFAKKVANRVVFMDEGQIVEMNSPIALFETPQHPRTQAFLNQILSY